MSESSPKREWLTPASLNLPSYIINDPDTDEPHASIVFEHCAISANSVKEILLVNRGQCRNPIMYLEFPVKVWEKRRVSDTINHCLDWQPDTHQLVNPEIARIGNLCYNPAILVCTGQAIDRGDVPIFRPCCLEQAGHVLAKVNWHILGLDDNACHHEEKAGRLTDQYLQETRRQFGAILYRRAVSQVYPYGADYWVFPLS